MSSNSGQHPAGNQGGVNFAGNTHIEGDVAGRDIVKNITIVSSGEVPEDLTTPEIERQPFEPETVLVSAGIFLMGSQPGEGIPEYETPQFEVEMPAFRIGKYPVTNDQYAQYIWRTGLVVSSTLRWQGNTPPVAQRFHPVTGINWYEAMDYCKWLSKTTKRHYTLPSEAQWEKAARFTDGRLFPWGNEWDESRCHCQEEGFSPVDAFPVQSEYGCFDMVGNCREWTTTQWGQVAKMPDPHLAYPWQPDLREDIANPTTVRRVFRGGKEKENRDYRCTVRGRYFPDKAGPRKNRHGFRVVLPLTRNQRTKKT